MDVRASDVCMLWYAFACLFVLVSLFALLLVFVGKVGNLIIFCLTAFGFLYSTRCTGLRSC